MRLTIVGLQDKMNKNFSLIISILYMGDADRMLPERKKKRNVIEPH